VFLAGKLPGVELGSINDLQEVQSMLAERVTEWTEEWKRQGMEKGLQQGRLEGEVALLLRQLELRFGELDETSRTRVHRADAETLLLWGERVLTAASLAEVIKS